MVCVLVIIILSSILVSTIYYYVCMLYSMKCGMSGDGSIQRNGNILYSFVVHTVYVKTRNDCFGFAFMSSYYAGLP